MLCSIPILLLLVIFFVSGVLIVTTYPVYRVALKQARRGLNQSPIKLFLICLLATIIMGTGMFGCVALNATIDEGALPIVLTAACIFVGAIGVFYSFYKRKANERDRLEVLRRFPVPKFKIWLQDLLVGSMSFGIAATVAFNIFAKEYGDLMPFVLALEFIIEFVAFVLALDVLRRSGVADRPIARALFIAALMLFSAFPPLALVSFAAWSSWQYALWKSRVE